MKIHRGILPVWIICFICLAGKASGTLDFVRTDLELTPAKLPFGKSLADYQSAAKMFSEEANSLTGTKVDWYRIDTLAALENESNHSQLVYGFSNGKLVAIQVNRLALDSNAERAARLKAALDGIFADFKKLDGKGYTRQDKDFQISYDGMCNATENIAAHITIALPNSAAPQDKSTGSISTASVTSSGRTSD